MTPTAPLLSPEFVMALLEDARWAPSGDNEQPWRVRVRDNVLEVLRDVDAHEAFLDVRLEATRIAMGSFAESLRLAALARGRVAELSFADDPTSPIWATVTIGQEQPPLAQTLASALKNRSSNRKLFDPAAWDHSDTEALLKACQGLNNIGVHVFTGSAALEPLSQAVAAADYVRMSHTRCTAEFHQKIYWTDAEARTAQTGFHYRTFEIRPHETLALRMTKNPVIFKIMRALVPMSALAAKLAQKQVLHSGAVVAFTVPEHSLREQAELGRSLLHVWLTAQTRGIQAQVLGVLSLFLRRVALGEPGFSPRELQRLAAAGALWEQVPGLPPRNQILLMLRLGRGEGPSARTFRLSPERLWLRDARGAG